MIFPKGVVIMPKLIEKDSPIYDVIWSNIRRIQYLERILLDAVSDHRCVMR